MRLATIALILASSSTAFAAEHLMRVGEVMLSNQGTTTSQFIELQDPGESFPGAGYSLKLFDAAGAGLGTITLTVPPGTTRLVVATATAATQFGITPSAMLTIALPNNGQACFSNGSANIHCLSWGTVTSAVPGGFGTDNGPTPPDGMSLQVVSGVYTTGTPSPGAANTAAVPDSSVVPDASVPDAPAATPDAPSGATPDAPGGNGNNPKDDDDGCNAGASASWFALVGLVGLVALRRRRS